MTYTFAQLEPEYATLWSAMETASERHAALSRIASGLAANRARYLTVSRQTRVPWFIIALIDQMEGGGGCDSHLHNGDPLSGRTVSVPKGRPPPDGRRPH